MPQFDVTAFGPQLFWLTISFGFLYYVVARFVAPKAELILANRDDFISQNLDQAEAYNRTTASLRAEIETSLEQAHNLAEVKAQTAAASLEQYYETRKAELSLRLQTKTNEALQQIDEMTESFHAKELQPCLNVAAFIIEKITRKPADLKVLAQIHQKIH